MEKENITNINEAKDKKDYKKKFLGIVAIFLLVFLGANVYAITQGYDNIFFMIKDLSTTGTIDGKSEILKDRDITLSYEQTEIEKISKDELTDTLSRYAILNAYKDLDIPNANYGDLGIYISEDGTRPTKEQFVNNNLVQCAIEYMKDKEIFNYEFGVSPNEINEVVKEMTGIEVNGHLDINQGFYNYSENNNTYSHFNGDGELIARCLDIINISYENGIYTVKYKYCYSGDESITKVDYEELLTYEAELKFKLNEEYKYTKYCIVSDVYNLEEN